MHILDSSALLALLKKEPGHQLVNNLIRKKIDDGESIFIHQINLIEVLYKIQKISPRELYLDLLKRFVSPFWGKINYLDGEIALMAADLKTKYSFASLGDVIGLSYTKLVEGTFWTADQQLGDIGSAEGIKVKLIR